MIRCWSARTLLLIVFTASLLSGCGSSLVIKSDPNEAEVFAIDPSAASATPTPAERKPIGKTPIDMKMSGFRDIAGEKISSGQYYILEVEKAGFQTQRILVPSTRFGTLVTALDVKMVPGNAKEEHTARGVLDHLFLSQKFALTKQYERAQAEIDRILEDVPNFPRALSMRASIFFIQGNLAESLRYYDLALKYDPQLEDAVKMSAKIRSMPGGARLPSAQTPPPATPPNPVASPGPGGTP